MAKFIFFFFHQTTNICELRHFLTDRKRGQDRGKQAQYEAARNRMRSIKNPVACILAGTSPYDAPLLGLLSEAEFQTKLSILRGIPSSPKKNYSPSKGIHSFPNGVYSSRSVIHAKRAILQTNFFLFIYFCSWSPYSLFYSKIHHVEPPKIS